MTLTVRNFVLLFLLSILDSLSFAQEFNFKIGISVDFGNEVKRIGLQFDFNSNYEFIQGNTFVGCYYNFSSWGVQLKTPEIKLGLGAHFGIGKKDNTANPYISLSDINLPHSYSIGYAYQYYFDWQGTSQSTGLFAFSFENLSVLTENDLFGAGKGWRDRFRTGGFKLSYRIKNYKFGINIQLYTGDYSSCTKVTDDAGYPARFGYRSQDRSTYGDKSLGILSLQFDYASQFYQTGRIDLGINSEKIRHTIQNKWLHDMPFYTDNMVKRQLMHIPMLKDDGGIYTFKDSELPKKGKLYYNLSINPSTFY